MKISEKERRLILQALCFRENESLGDDELNALIKRFESKEPELKLYILDFGWRGSVSVVAGSSDEAKKLFIEAGHPEILDDFFNDSTDDLEGKEINVGVINFDYGDA